MSSSFLDTPLNRERFREEVPEADLFLPVNLPVDFHISLLFDEILFPHNGTFPTRKI